jgi:ABC-type branched-subunit amino acid transport system ATPase component
MSEHTGAPMDIILEVRSLKKHFGGIKAVDDCNFKVEKGKITGLIGPNGSGKTTCFNLITGFIPSDDGDVIFNGKHISGQSPNVICHHGMVRTFQITRLFKRMSVLENMIVPIRQVGLRSLFTPSIHGHERDRALELLEFVGLTKLKEEYAGNLSYGQQKLLEFAAILMAEPDMILLDEPTGGVNPVMVERMESHFRELNNKGVTFLIVEHNMNLIMDICDWVIVLHHGKEIAVGPAEDIQQDPDVLEAYLGD